VRVCVLSSARVPQTTRNTTTLGLFAAVLLSGSTGLWLGARQAVWQDAVEPSQVLAEVVVYPDPANPFYLYQTRVATLVHPLGAAALRRGWDEIALSRIMSAGLGAVCYAAVGAWVFGLTRNVPFAAAVPPLLVLLDMRDWGVRYPLSLMDGNTYGVLGVGLLMLALGLVASGEGLSGGLVAGLAPAFHAVLGSWCLLLLGVSLSGRGREVPRRAAALRGALIGMALSGGFLAAHLIRAPPRPEIDPGLAAAYVSTFHGEHWHQGPLDPSLPPVLLLLSVAALVAVRLSSGRDEAEEGTATRVLLRMTLVATVLGFIVAGVHTALGPWSPRLLVVAMPGRLLNPAVLAAFLSLLGLLWRARAHPLAVVNLATLVGTCLAVRLGDVPDATALMLRSAALSSLALLLTSTRSTAAARRGLPGAALPLALLVLAGASSRADKVTCGAAALTLLCLVLRAVWRSAPADPLEDALPSPWMAGALLVAFVSAGGWAAAELFRRPPFEFRDRTNDSVLRRASEGRGFLVASSGLGGYVQRLTRRPLLLDTEQLDALPYVPETGPAIERILKRVYGVPFFDLALHEKDLWQQRETREWEEIGAELQVTDVLTEPSWRLQLPEVARNDLYSLYSIPQRVGVRRGDARAPTVRE
jgi:hypothetical protein